MLNFPFIMLFVFILIFSTFFSLSSSHWLGIWLGLELNLMSFIPIMVQYSKVDEVESSIKYFLTQSIASSFLLLSSLTLFWSEGNWEIMSMSTINSSNMILFSLLMKMGAAPFHFWVPSVMSGLSWEINLLLLTWQKVVPLFMVSFFFSISKEVLLILILLSSIIGGIGGLNQVSIRGLMAYSSILHLGWMISASIVNFNVCCLYFILYSFILMSAFFLMMIQETKNSKQFFNIFMWSNSFRALLLTMILSMGGMPPMLGFFMKWMVLSSLIMTKFYFISFILIMGSMISLYYYLTLSFSLILSYEISWKLMITTKMNLWFMIFMTINFSGLILIYYFSSYL
uniref:NADH-ubiquinone oxidoreductase chain 2 n=1 Tax=Chiton albolineatus TaxID=2719130 RepID=A0A6H1PGZ0_9MOLL|nr:NADH dehydrogenase subunit 2 [Chiton albolineatus]QIZ12642.1 NADH dehydrogenase subunit 2 [Chiton albolineatus]